MAHVLHLGDCLDVMRGMEDCSVDSIVTDPPYGLTANKKGGTGDASINLESPYGRARIGTGTGPGGFMGMKWDSGVPPVEVWVEALRVLKPGGHLLAFSGSRTYHRMTVAIEDAGFEIRDQIMWVYGSGFPKSLNLDGDHAGWGTALKPAHEPICVARKPLIGTVAANVLAHGTGAINIDGCRVATNPDVDDPRLGGNGSWATDKAARNVYEGGFVGERIASSSQGRWPANLIHDGSDEVIAAFPNAPGQMADASADCDSIKTDGIYGLMRRGRGDEASADSANDGAVGFKMKPGARRLDSGSAARFFYCAKASKSDRNEGLERFEKQRGGAEQFDSRWKDGVGSARQPIRANIHPTVKPTELMAYLCRLITPTGGIVLDPFMGSGSTGKAAIQEGFQFVGIELSADYFEIAKARIEAEERAYQPKLFEDDAA